jgi:hypothetical protein
VVAREDTPGNKRLVAYYTCREESGEPSTGKRMVEAAELRAHVAAGLPEYMIPAAYVRLDKLPLTSHGKVNRKALPVPEGNAYAVGGYESPRGEIETTLAGIWATVLNLQQVGRHDNFFQLGGHSLLVVKVIADMRRAGLQADVREFFISPTIAELAAAINPQTDAVEVPPNRIPPEKSREYEIELTL